jgi:hypothetical protein
MRRLMLITGLLLGACGDGRQATIEKACLIFEGGPALAHDGAAPWTATVGARHDLTLTQAAGRFSLSGVFAAPQNSAYVLALTPRASVEIGVFRDDLGPICGGKAQGYEVSLTATEHAVSIAHEAARASVVFAENERKRRVSSSSGFDFD